MDLQLRGRMIATRMASDLWPVISTHDSATCTVMVLLAAHSLGCSTSSAHDSAQCTTMVLWAAHNFPDRAIATQQDPWTSFAVLVVPYPLDSPGVSRYLRGVFFFSTCHGGLDMFPDWSFGLPAPDSEQILQHSHGNLGKCSLDSTATSTIAASCVFSCTPRLPTVRAMAGGSVRRRHRDKLWDLVPRHLPA